jgi:hypothetical protein
VINFPILAEKQTVFAERFACFLGRKGNVFRWENMAKQTVFLMLSTQFCVRWSVSIAEYSALEDT